MEPKFKPRPHCLGKNENMSKGQCPMANTYQWFERITANQKYSSKSLKCT